MAFVEKKQKIYLYFFFFLCYVVPTFSQSNETCNSDDFQALQGFLRGLESGIAGWSLNASASASSTCCILPGVSCDQTQPLSGQRVVGLELTNMSLSGNLSDSLAGLPHLRRLNLSSNSLQGSVPRQLFNLPELELLDLSLNVFSGFIPFDNITLPSISVLNVSYNGFSGSIDVSGICNSSSIQFLSFSMNMFTGQFPNSIGNCRTLRHLSLDMNSVSGGLPDDLFTLSSSLSELYLQQNSLSGPLSARLGNLSGLVHLDVSMNEFSGFIPDVFTGLMKLETFSAEFNRFRGSLPASLASLANLRVLSLRNNSLGGVISLDFSGMVKLNSLDLSINFFNGSLPHSLSRCSELVTLNLGRNNFVGEIPNTFKNMTNLTYLLLSKIGLSNLSSALEVLQHCPNLTYLVLTRNFYQGETMPSDRIVGFKKMEVLVIANCALKGSIPQWLTSSAGLMVLDISWNILEGTIPGWLGHFDSLFYLDISNNSLTGDIPVSLTRMKNLISINASHGGDAIQNFPLFAKRNGSAKGLQYNQVSSFPPSLILSNNKLSGEVSPSFGNLKSLLVFDLHMNNISGPIPDELSEMMSLETLDLSYNNLTGVIPPSLVKLNFLSRFDVAHNNLFGPIPMGGQFSTFSRSNFLGNPGLCGFHLSPCSSSEAPPPTTIFIKKNKGAAAGMAIGIGIGTASLLTVIYLVVSRARCRRQDDKAKVVADADDEHIEVLGSSLVLLFQNKDQSGLTIDDILKSTNNFDQASIIGCGGFGLVYKATLPDGRKVAIKRLSGDFCQMEREFQAEVETLSRAQHRNLVLLQGYCRAGNDRLLMYSYMENGSLDYWLHERAEGEALLDWSTRLRIAQGSARGLAYLHHSCQPHILHRDVKSSNILLDENFEAHLADFGLARLILPQKTHVTTDLVGTLGYIPPEYGQSSVATYRGDVYSFGVVLLELLTGRRPVDICKPKGCRDLILWVLEKKKGKREEQVFDPYIYDDNDDDDDDDDDTDGQMRKVLDIACLCVSESPKLRPLTEQLVTWLDELGSASVH